MPEFENTLNDPETNLSETLLRARQIVVRRRWWILVPACCVALATIAIVRILPNRYTSEATLLVVQQQVPQRYVVPNSTTDISSELQAMKQEILSRPRLNDIIREFSLYPKAAKRKAPEQIIELMLRDIDIQPLQGPAKPNADLDGFKISFTTEDPVVAQQVTSKLTSLFIQGDLKVHEEQDTNTTTFLHAQLENAREKLAELEQKVKDFKMQNLGELPEEQQGNLAIMASLQTQLQNATAAMSRAQEQRAALQTLLAGYQAALSVRGVQFPGLPDSGRTVSPIDAAQADLDRLKLERAKLAVTRTPEHPDMITNQAEIAAAEATVANLKQGASKTPQGRSPEARSDPTPAEATPAEQPALTQVRSQLEANQVEMQNLAKEEAQLKAKLEQYQTRLNMTPVREQQMAGIMRDYEFQKQAYGDLLAKEQQSQLATNLGKDQRGQQFRLVDPPSLPALPSSPKRLKLNLGGAAGGFALGLALALLMEMLDRSFHRAKELIERFTPPFAVSIPLLLTPGESRARTWGRTVQWLTGSALVTVVLVAEFYAYRHP